MIRSPRVFSIDFDEIYDFKIETISMKGQRFNEFISVSKLVIKLKDKEDLILDSFLPRKNFQYSKAIEDLTNYLSLVKTSSENSTVIKFSNDENELSENYISPTELTNDKRILASIELEILEGVEKQEKSILFFTPKTTLDGTTVIELSIHNVNLVRVPENIKYLENLKKISLCGNNLENIPDWIFNMGSLEVLEIKSNKIRQLPESIKKLQELRVLDIQHNEILSIPAEIGNLRKLEAIYLGGNKLTSLPSTINKLERLTYLDLSYNPLHHLPNSVCSLSSLRELVVMGIATRELPDLRRMESLESLNISSNWNIEINESLLELPSLSHFSCHSCYLKIVPKCFLQILKRLNEKGCDITPNIYNNR